MILALSTNSIYIIAVRVICRRLAVWEEMSSTVIVSCLAPASISQGVAGREGNLTLPYFLHHSISFKANAIFRFRSQLKCTYYSGRIAKPRVVRGATQLDAEPSALDKQIVPESDFSITKISFGVVGLVSGCTLLSYGFGSYFSILPGAEWSALMLTYGFPLAIIGMALKYAELQPVPCITYSNAKALRETQATPILNQVRQDVTRFRYGDEQHLDEALKRIFRYGQAGGIQRRNAPVLKTIREEVTAEGKYSLVLVFEAKALELTDFEQRQAKFASFFGPGISAEIGTGGKNLYEVRLISNGVTQAAV